MEMRREIIEETFEEHHEEVPTSPTRKKKKKRRRPQIEHKQKDHPLAIVSGVLFGLTILGFCIYGIYRLIAG